CRGPGGHCTLEGDRRRPLQLDEQVDQRLSDERVLVDALTPLLALCGVDRGFEERPAVDAEPHERDTEPTAVHHLHHLVDAASSRTALSAVDLAARTSRHPCACALEAHL